MGAWFVSWHGSLQREALHNRRRKRALLASLTAFRRAADILPDALCVIDQEPRETDPERIAQLTDLARMVEQEISVAELTSEAHSKNVFVSAIKR